MRERAHEQRAGVADTRRCPVLGHGLLHGPLQREGSGPVTQEFLQLEHSRDAVQPVVWREEGRGLLVAECVPPRILELTAGDRRAHAGCIHEGLRIGIVELTRDRGAPAAPLERLRVLAADE